MSEAVLVAVIGGVTTILSHVMTKNNIKKKAISEWLSSHNEKHQDIDTSLLLTHKQQILDIYNRGKVKGALGEHEKEFAAELFEQYRELGGNGYIDHVVERIQDM